MSDFIETTPVGRWGDEDITNTTQRPQYTSKAVFNQGIAVEHLSANDQAFIDILAELREKHERQAQLIVRLENLGGCYGQPD